MDTLKEIRVKLNVKRRELDKWKSTLKAEKKNLKSAAQEVADFYAAQEILQQVAQDVEQQAHKRIHSVVTKCLKLVFGEDAYEFEIKFEQKRGKTEAVLQFKRDCHKVDPITEAGGGPVDIAAFALRLACISLQLPARRRIIIMDEPFNTLHKSLHERVKSMLEMLSDELDFQFIFITHEEGFAAGKIVVL